MGESALPLEHRRIEVLVKRVLTEFRDFPAAEQSLFLSMCAGAGRNPDDFYILADRIANERNGEYRKVLVRDKIGRKTREFVCPDMTWIEALREKLSTDKGGG